MSDDKPLLIAPSSLIPQVTMVRIYAETLDHVREHHGLEMGQIAPNLPSLTAAVVSAITNPTHIENPRPGSYVFVDAESTNAAGDAIRAPTKIISGTSALLKTFYFASTTGERNIVWRRT
ncbi:MAG TPA: hypothetical protein VHZ26_04645 [Caulobacteraceae bacterium]|nr:hypothetical protein [Caulobacteraceae bacterium]